MKHHRVENNSGDFSTLAGAIFMASGVTRKECFKLKLFGLPSSQSGLVKRIKAGMILFLFDYDERKLYGVFEATSDGSMNIMRDAYASSGMRYPSQIQFKIIWKCSPLKEDEFRDCIIENYFTPNKFNFDLSYEQVMNLIQLFSSKRCTSVHHHDQIGKTEKHMKLRRNYDADMDNMTHQNYHVEFDDSEHSRNNTTDSKGQQHTIENDFGFSIFPESHSITVEGSKVYAPGEYAEEFCAPHPHISDFTGYTNQSISNIPGNFPTSSPHLRHNYYLPSYLHEQLPTVAREINPSFSSTLTDYRKSAIVTNSQHLGDLPYLAQHNSRMEFPPSACRDINETISYEGYRDLSNPIYKYSPDSLTFASQGCNNIKNSNYKSCSELYDHFIMQDDVSSPRMLLKRGTNSLTSILGVSNCIPCHKSSPGILLANSKDPLNSNLGVSSSSVSPQSRQTKESSRDLYNWHSYPYPSYNLMSENKDVIKDLEYSDLQRSSFRNSSLLKYGYPSTFEDCNDNKSENVFDDMEASMVFKDSEKNPYLLNFTDKVHNEIQHYHTSQDEQEAYIPYSHRLLDNHHRRSSVFTRLSNVQKSQELEELTHEPKTNPSVEELVEIMELRRQKGITSRFKETINQDSNKLKDFPSLENSVHDQDMNPSIDKLVEIMELRRKKWSSGTSPLKKIINEARNRSQECLSRKTIKPECVSPVKLYRVDPPTNPKSHPESIPETVEFPFVNFRRRTDASKVSGETRQTVHKRRKLIRPSFIQETILNQGNTESSNVLGSSEVAAGGRSFLLSEEVHQSNPVGNPVIESLENITTEEQKHVESKTMARSSLTEFTPRKEDSKNSNLLNSEEGDGIGHEFQTKLPLRPTSQSSMSNVIDVGCKKTTFFRSSLSEEYGLGEESCKNSNMSGSCEEMTDSGSLRTDLDVQRLDQTDRLIESPKSTEAPQGTTKRRKLARLSFSEKDSLNTGDNIYANRWVCSKEETPADLVINGHEKTETLVGTHKRSKFVIPCLNEEDKLSKGHSKCSNVLSSSEVVAKSLYEVPRLILFGNPLIEGPENPENEHTSHPVGLVNTDSGQLKNVETTVINENHSGGSNKHGVSVSVMDDNVIGIVEKPEEKESNLIDRSGMETYGFSDGSPTVMNINTGSGQLKNVETTVINENHSGGSNEHGISVSVMDDNVIGIVEKSEENESNLIDRSGTETYGFNDGSPTVMNIDTGSGQLKNVKTTVINENHSGGSNEHGISTSVLDDNVVSIVEKSEENESRSGTETNSFSDGSPRVMNINISTDRKAFGLQQGA